MWIFGFLNKGKQGEEKKDGQLEHNTTEITDSTSEDIWDIFMQEKHVLASSTDNTPEVFYDPEDKFFAIIGRCIPENTTPFWQPIHQAIKKFSTDESLDIEHIALYTEYFNTASSKHILDIFKEDIPKDKHVYVNRYYEEDDEDMLEAWEDFNDVIGVVKTVYDRETVIVPTEK